MRENLKISIVIKNVTGSEKPLMHKEERPSNKKMSSLCPNFVRNIPDRT